MQAEQIDTSNESETRDPEPLTNALRELEAARARVERGARQVHDETRSKLVASLLPVLDNLDRTIRAAEDNDEAPALLEGTRQVRAQLERVLCGYGIERIDALGQLFDPTLHDAIHVTRSRDPAFDRRVVDQLEPGYRFGDRLLRPAKVVVARTDGR
jgi:molecular chaperone GrpE